MAATIASSREASANIALLDQIYIEQYGVYTRLQYSDRTLTNVDEWKYAAAVAGVLRAHNVGPGDRVLAMMPNMPELTVLLQAVWNVGAVAVPIMPQWTALEAEHVVRDCGAVVAVTVPPLAPRLHEACRENELLRHLLVFGEVDAPGAINLIPQLQSASPVVSPAHRSSDDLALLLYTSGTTGTPKGAMLSHGNIRAALDSFYRHNPDLPRGPMLQVLPLSHSFGLLMFCFANRSGFSNVLLPQFDPVKVFQAIERHQVQYAPVVPTMLFYLLHHPERGQYNLSSLRRLSSGGAALPEKVRAAAAHALGCRVDQGYGLSESFAVAATYQPDSDYRPGAVGKPTPGVQIRIINEKNDPAPPLAIGEICISSPHIALGYWNDPDSTRESFVDGWLHTGDVGYFDADGYLFITDRKKDLIIKGGENISPREIEEVLYGHPAIAEAAVMGVPDSVFGEEVWAFVQLRPGAETTEEAIKAHAGNYVTKFKVPAHVVFQQALPKNSIGKISKREIRERLTQEQMNVTSAVTSPS